MLIAHKYKFGIRNNSRIDEKYPCGGCFFILVDPDFIQFAHASNLYIAMPSDHPFLLTNKQYGSKNLYGTEFTIFPKNNRRLQQEIT